MALVNPEKDSKYIYKYIFQSVEFKHKKKNEKIDLSFPSIMSLEYLLNIDNNLTSVIKLSLRLDPQKKTWIIRNRRNLEVIMNLGKSKYNQDNDNGNSSGDLVFDGKFIPIFAESNSSTDSAILSDAVDSELNDASELSSLNHSAGEEVMDVYLFKEKILKCSRVSCNMVFKKDTLQNIVGALLTKTKHEKVLMNKFENEEEYVELLIPENPLYKCLMYLDQYYGFYKAGAIIFYDIDQLYILDSSYEKPVNVKDEKTNITILIDTLASTSPVRGVVEKQDDDTKYIYVAESEVNITKSSWINESDFGSKIYMNVVNPESDKENNEKNSLLDSEIEHIGEKKMERYKNIDHDNKYAKESLDARMNEQESILYINASSIDIDFLKPNKVYTVIFSNARKHDVYKDCKYRLALAHTILSQEDNAYFTASHRFILKKCGGEIHNDNDED